MKKLALYSTLTLVLVIALWTVIPAAGYTLTEAMLLYRAWNPAGLWTFKGGGTAIFSGLLSSPPAPSASAGPTSGGFCTSASTYRFYVSYKNFTGETLLSPASGDFTPSSGSVNKITVTRGTIPAEASIWKAWFTRSNDGHVAIRGCTTLGGTADVSSGTPTFDCICSVVLDPPEPTSNTTADVTPISWATNASAAFVSRPELAVKEVCLRGCEFQTVTDALASITDASDTNRYIVFMRAPFQSGTTPSITMKSFVSLVGENRFAVKIKANILLPAASGIEVGFDNFTMTGNTGIQTSTATGGIVYMSNLICGDAVPTNIDCFANFSSTSTGITIHSSNNLLRSAFDFFRLSQNDILYDTGSTYIASNNSDQIRIWSTTGNQAAHFYVENPTVIINPSDSWDAEITGLHIGPGAGSTTRGVRAIISGGTIRINSTHATRTATMRCVFLGDGIGANSFESEVSIIGTECVISSASASGKVIGMEVQADVDHANWTSRWIGGRIAVSGGASASDIENNETVGGFSLLMSSVENGGVYTGAGTITAADSRIGAFTTRLRGRVGDLVAATCTNNEIALDTGGANKEICICDGGAWACVTATTATGPTN